MARWRMMARQPCSGPGSSSIHLLLALLVSASLGGDRSFAGGAVLRSCPSLDGFECAPFTFFKVYQPGLNATSCAQLCLAGAPSKTYGYMGDGSCYCSANPCTYYEAALGWETAIASFSAPAPPCPSLSDTAPSTPVATNEPTPGPTAFGDTTAPTMLPTTAPSNQPSQSPTMPPTTVPSNLPSQSPTMLPTTAPSNLPSQSPTMLPTTAPSNQPSQSPTTLPTVVPSKAPTSRPSASPTFRPSALPTSWPSTSPTNFLSFEPLPPDDPVQLVATDYVCGPEVYLTRRRLQQEEQPAKTASMMHRELAVWTPDACYFACAARLGYPPTFLINIYNNETTGEQVCTCCRICGDWRYVPGAHIFATCMAGDGTNSLLRFKSKVSHHKIGVKPGKLVRYEAHVKNIDKTIAAAGLALTIELPAGVTIVKSKTSGNFAMEIKQGKTRYRSHVPFEGLLKMTTTPVTATWYDLLFPPRKSIKFELKIRVDPDVQALSRLTFSASLYQRLPVNRLPYCANTRVNQSFIVK